MVLWGKNGLATLSLAKVLKGSPVKSVSHSCCAKAKFLRKGHSQQLFFLKVTALVFTLALIAPAHLASAEPRPLHVFAAASLAIALEPLARTYRQDTEQTLLISYGASSTLSRQISYGAPAQIFISANPRWMQTLIESGQVSPEAVQNLIGNQLLLVAPAASTVKPVADLPTPDELEIWLSDKRMAVGDPQHVPVGIYAKAALQQLGLWQAVEHRLAPTEDARASLALLQRNEVALGLIYSSDLSSVPDLKVLSNLALQKEQQIVYPIAIIGDDPTGSAKHFVNFLRSPSALQSFVQLGFTELL